jgi:hypothetical protein
MVRCMEIRSGRMQKPRKKWYSPHFNCTKKNPILPSVRMGISRSYLARGLSRVYFRPVAHPRPEAITKKYLDLCSQSAMKSSVRDG